MGNYYRFGYAGRVCASDLGEPTKLHLYYRGWWIFILLVLHWISFLAITVVCVLKY